uniref:phage portal protein n=1 Tax=Bacillus velezensis TaxID=492670 RepID=UPI000AF3A9CC
MHKINELDRATFNNIEHQSIEYVKNTLQPWLVSFEQEIITKLFTDEEIKDGFYIKST